LPRVVKKASVWHTKKLIRRVFESGVVEYQDKGKGTFTLKEANRLKNARPREREETK